MEETPSAQCGKNPIGKKETLQFINQIGTGNHDRNHPNVRSLFKPALRQCAPRPFFYPGLPSNDTGSAPMRCRCRPGALDATKHPPLHPILLQCLSMSV